MLNLVLAAHAASTLAMTGIIWFVQLVHYPLMLKVGSEGFCDYEREHTRRTTWIVAPTMCIEAASSVCLALLVDTISARILTLVGLVLLAMVWSSTFWLQVPAHGRLVSSFDRQTVSRLVRTNWIRTVAWTARAVLAIAMLLLTRPGTAS